MTLRRRVSARARVRVVCVRMHVRVRVLFAREDGASAAPVPRQCRAHPRPRVRRHAHRQLERPLRFGRLARALVVLSSSQCSKRARCSERLTALAAIGREAGGASGRRDCLVEHSRALHVTVEVAGGEGESLLFRIGHKRARERQERLLRFCARIHTMQRRCGRGGPSPGADLARVCAIPVRMWRGVSPAPVQMRAGMSPVLMQMRVGG